MKTNNIKLGWVKPKVMEDLKGLTYQSLRKKRNQGYLIEGRHWKKIFGVVMYHYERIDELFEEFNEQTA